MEEDFDYKKEIGMTRQEFADYLADNEDELKLFIKCFNEILKEKAPNIYKLWNNMPVEQQELKALILTKYGVDGFKDDFIAEE